MMSTAAATAIERIVVQATPQEKKTITAKAKKLGMPVSELMRRGATAYDAANNDAELGELADRAKLAAERASSSIDDVLAFVTASNKRIAAMEAKAAKTAAPVAAKPQRTRKVA
jgi:predicted RNA methylase